MIKNYEIIEYLNELNIIYNGTEYNFKLNDTFNNLTIISLVRYKQGKYTRKGCICKCSCGNIIGPQRLFMLINGDLTSCGCLSRKKHKEMMIKQNTIHGDSKRKKRSKLYILWASMKDRATNKNKKDAKYYASKENVSICEEWLNYQNFKKWALKNNYKEGLSIERKDVNKGYCPENCTFINIKDQNKNKSTTRTLTYKNESHNITDWGKITGLSWNVIDRRLKKGYTIGQALGFEKIK